MCASSNYAMHAMHACSNHSSNDFTTACRYLQAFRPTFRSDDNRGLGDVRTAGALLTVAWLNGRVANYPLYFPCLEGEHNKPPYAPTL
jgi:hypothetical protein